MLDLEREKRFARYEAYKEVFELIKERETFEFPETLEDYKKMLDDIKDDLTGGYQ